MTTELITEVEGPSLESAEFKATVKKALTDMVHAVEELSVTNEVAYKTVTRIYKDAREWKKVVESARKQLVDPFREEISRINDVAKSLTDPLDSVIALANLKCGAYSKLLQEQKVEEERRLKEAASLFDAEEEVFVAPLEKSIRGDGAITVTKKVKKFRVEDVTKVPLKYMMVNSAAIDFDLKMGINEIPGIEIYEEEVTTLRTR